MVNLVFDNSNVPTPTNRHHNNIFIYQDPSGNIQSPEDLFIQVTTPDNDFTTYISIMTFIILVSQSQCNPIQHDNGLPILYFDQLSTISKHLNEINKHIKSPNSTSHITKLDNSNTERNKYLLKLIHSIKTYGTLRAVNAVLPKNK